MTEEEQTSMYGYIKQTVARCPKVIRHVEKQDADIAAIALTQDLDVLNMIDVDVFDANLVQILLQCQIQEKHVESIEILAAYLPDSLSVLLLHRVSDFDSPFKRKRCM